jgi:ATP-binding cassette subfamily B protein
MTRKKLDFRGQAFKDVLGFTFHHWAQQPWRILVITGLVLLSALADVLTPMFAGRLVDAIASGAASNAVAWHAAVTAFCVLSALGLGATLLRQGVYFNIIRLTLKMMSEIAANAFHRVQRFSRTASPAPRCARSHAVCGHSTCSTTRC